MYQTDDDYQEVIYENRSDTGCFIDLIYVVIYLRNSLFGIFSVIWVIVYKFKIVQGQPESLQIAWHCSKKCMNW
ncbi:MAG: hypothetical protein AAF915_01550 [Cyanobacteria bacterium P01_D01_bin.50]